MLFLTGIPFGMTATEHNNWWYHMGGREFGEELGERFNLKNVCSGEIQQLKLAGGLEKPVNGPEDFVGLKFRMPGLGGKALGLMGGISAKYSWSRSLSSIGNWGY